MKIAICIPCYGQTHAKFTYSLAQLIAFTMAADIRDAHGERFPVEIETFVVSSSMLTESRHKLVAEALAWEADYMLCLDADHVFPKDALVRLLGHSKAIVGCNYPRRATPTAPTAAQAEGGLLYTTQEKANAGLVEECGHLGFGLLLIDCRVFDALQAWAEREEGGNFLPLFLFEPTENKVGMIGEDVFFFRKLKKAGIVPWVDHGLSWEVGHLHEIILTNAHADTQKDSWVKYLEKRDERIRKAAEA